MRRTREVSGKGCETSRPSVHLTDTGWQPKIGHRERSRDQTGRWPGATDAGSPGTGAGSGTMMEYQGYVATVEYDDSVERLHGRVVNTGAYPVATFESPDVRGLRAEFQRSIDEYLASCREDGVEPLGAQAPR